MPSSGNTSIIFLTQHNTRDDRLAGLGLGATLNGRPIHVNSDRPLADAMVGIHIRNVQPEPLAHDLGPLPGVAAHAQRLVLVRPGQPAGGRERVSNRLCGDLPADRAHDRDLKE